MYAQGLEIAIHMHSIMRFSEEEIDRMPSSWTMIWRASVELPLPVGRPRKKRRKEIGDCPE
jgi:hypothetical protein